MSEKCNDCDRSLGRRGGLISASTAEVGTYYDGPPICFRCAEARYELHVAETDRETNKGER